MTSPVSDEDREAGVQILLAAYDRLPSVFQSPQLANELIDALITQGWEPRSLVSRKEMERHLFYAVPGLLDQNSKAFDALLSAAIGAVMMAGIEITE